MAEIDATPEELLAWAEEATRVIDIGLPAHEMRKAVAVVALLRSVASAPQPTPQQSADAVKISFFNYCLNAGVGR